jgi:hypothetical protein
MKGRVMKKLLLGLLLVPVIVISSGQIPADTLVSECLLSTGPTSKYLKDFRIQLGKGSHESEFRYKENISLWKNTKYRFTLCSADNSKGQLILNIRDELNNSVLSSVDSKTGTVYSTVDLTCNKSGVYQIYFDFTGGESGSGVSIVSMVQ